MAHVLAQAVRNDEVEATDALRILRHELRRRNTNQALKIEIRSKEAQRVIEKWGAESVPKNSSPDALHADHVYPLTADELQRNVTLEQWIGAMPRLRTVVCVTAQENYVLEKYEKQGVTGPEKYEQAGVAFTTDRLPWATDDPNHLDLRDVPGEDATWEEIAQFSETFDGYKHFGEAWGERVGAVRERYGSSRELPAALDDLRGCLFCEFRIDRFTWGEDVVLSEPNEQGVREILANPNFESSETQRYRRAIVARIRELLT